MYEDLFISDDTLGRAPGRVWQLLVGLRYVAIWKKLYANGLTIDDVKAANTHLDNARMGLMPAPVEVASPEAEARAAAVAELSTFDELWLVKYPLIAAMVSILTANWMFSDLTAAVGQAESLQVVETILTRLDALENGDAPEGLDASVVDALGARGLSKAERERVSGLVRAARDTSLLPAPAPTQQEKDETLRATLVQLHLFWKAASGNARTAGLKKVELIRLGLASPAKKKAKQKPDDVS